MKFHKIKSHAKINLSLGILGKFKSRLHKIESLVSFLNLYDDILIKKVKSKKHEVKFKGQFSKRIKKNNTILNLLKILDDSKKLRNQKFLIKINKKIPLQSGMGGGSMNAASILNYLLKNKKVELSKKEIVKIASKIGSDVIIGMKKKNSILYGNGDLKIINKSINLFTVLIKPNFGCPTKEIYNNVRSFSKTVFPKNHKVNLSYKFLSNLRNDLEFPAFDKYPTLKKIKKLMEKLDNVLFVRMTGSGSTMVGYFNSKKAALNAEKLLKKKYKNYWCILSKTI